MLKHLHSPFLFFFKDFQLSGLIVGARSSGNIIVCVMATTHGAHIKFSSLCTGIDRQRSNPLLQISALFR
jgi:hypothetical protein